MIYLASPYSSEDALVREQRFHDACRATIRLMKSGHVVFSPVVHSHPLVAYGLPTDWSFWQKADRDHIARCDKLIVLMLDGWRESIGVTAEIQIARELAKPVRFLPLNSHSTATPGRAGCAYADERV